MKCPKCAYNHKAKYGMNCSCGYRFTFNPKERSTSGFTDGKFVAAMRRASQNETIHFTLNQLYSAYASKVSSLAGVLYGAAAVFFVIGLFVVFSEVIIGIVLFGISALCFTSAVFHRPRVFSQDEFRKLVDRWTSAGKELPGLITGPTLHSAPEQWTEEDIYDYGVERMLIVERDILVDLFVKNNQHAELRMLVMSENGYPNYLRSTAADILSERPGLPVFLLHDATPNGCGMTDRVRHLDWLDLREHPVTDLGFVPNDFERMKRTKNYENRLAERCLPVDAMLAIQLHDGLTYCLENDITLSQLILQRAQTDSTGSFG